MPARRRLELFGLPIATAAFGIAGTVLGLLSIPLGAGIAVSGAIIVAVLDVLGRVQSAQEDAAAERRAIERVSEAARTFRTQLAAGMPLGGTTVADGTPAERLMGMAEQLREGRFMFLSGRRWRDWSGVGSALMRGRQEILAAAGLVGHRLPTVEEANVRAFAALLGEAAHNAFAVSSSYAGYDVTEEPKLPRFMPEDRDVDASRMTEYSSFAREFTAILTELDRMARLSSTTG